MGCWLSLPLGLCFASRKAHGSCGAGAPQIYPMRGASEPSGQGDNSTFQQPRMLRAHDNAYLVDIRNTDLDIHTPEDAQVTRADRWRLLFALSPPFLQRPIEDIDAVRNYAASGQGAQPFGDWYETTNAVPEAFRARPVVGGHLALVCLSANSLSATSNLPLLQLVL